MRSCLLKWAMNDARLLGAKPDQSSSPARGRRSRRFPFSASARYVTRSFDFVTIIGKVDFSCPNFVTVASSKEADISVLGVQHSLGFL